MASTQHDKVGTKPVVIGLYGIPGAGKSTLKNKLKAQLGEVQFSFHEGSEFIASLVPGGLSAFQQASEEEKTRWRHAAIADIQRQANNSGRAAVVTGHFMFWQEGETVGQTVLTQSDLDTYTHILYLATPPGAVAGWRHLDQARARKSVTTQHLRTWQEVEVTQLRNLCRDAGVLFASLSGAPDAARVAALLLDFQKHNEDHNFTHAQRTVDEVINARRHGEGLHTALVLDADKTLAAQDASALFWSRVVAKAQACTKDDPLQALFGGRLGYSYLAFRQATLLYEETTTDVEFNAICEEVASSLSLYPEMEALLRHAGKHGHVLTVVLTCGLRRVWEIVLEKAGFSDNVKVLDGGRISDGFVVTGEVKGAVTTSLRDKHSLYVWAVGDSPLDLHMMHQAHQAIVVSGDVGARSKTMDKSLLEAIDQDGLRARQVLLPSNASPRLDTKRLPLMRFTEREFLDAVIRRRGLNDRFAHATTRTAAQLLMTPTRDATVGGPALRDAHGRIGWYLATDFLPDVVGVEEYSIPHVQGHATSGHRIWQEAKTTIVALMRGGEPMAFGVNEALPGAMFVHAKQPTDLQLAHVKGQWTVLLVDSVINNGKSMAEFVQRIRSLDATVSIVVVAGVVQEESLSAKGLLGQLMHEDKALSLVALRLSRNKFTGRGTTDTGNRLFNTTQIP